MLVANVKEKCRSAGGAECNDSLKSVSYLETPYPHNPHNLSFKVKQGKS